VGKEKGKARREILRGTGDNRAEDVLAIVVFRVRVGIGEHFQGFVVVGHLEYDGYPWVILQDQGQANVVRVFRKKTASKKMNSPL
jgi:hypothetical protein